MKIKFYILLLFIGFTFKGFSQHEISLQEKLYGLSTLWQEVNYNFAFFDQVPDLNWDEEYKRTIDQVIESESDLEYYLILQSLMVKLNDGHTQVFLPENLQKLYGCLPIAVQEEQGEYYVINIANQLKQQLPIGSQLVSINQLPITEYIQDFVRPFQASSTPQGLSSLIEQNLFYGLKDEAVQLTFQHESATKQISLNRNEYYGEMVNNCGQFKTHKPFLYRKENNVSIVEINSFEQEDVVEQFADVINQINKTDGLVIDIRENIGGQAIVALNIAKYLVENNEIIDVRWKSRNHIASHKAWGNSGLQLVGYNQISEFSDFGDLNSWIEIEPDTLSLPKKRLRVKVPIKVLISENTASSAENFLVYLFRENNIETIGAPTFGSTGQPIYFPLPGNGYARVCAKRNYFPNGDEFVGYGIKPDIEMKPTIENKIAKKDIVLETAIEHLLQ